VQRDCRRNLRRLESRSRTSLARPGAWLNLLPLGDAAKPSAHEELAQAPRQGAVREAERVFQPPWQGVQPVEMQDKLIEPVTLIERPIRPLRVLPDLTAAAREQQPRAAFHAPARKRAPKGSLTTKRHSKIRREEPTTADLLTSMEAPAKPARALNGHVAAAMAMNRNQTRPKIPPGQRWRERRLPRVCWIRRG
jgi:hypothetical protein